MRHFIYASLIGLVCFAVGFGFGSLVDQPKPTSSTVVHSSEKTHLKADLSQDRVLTNSQNKNPSLGQPAAQSSSQTPSTAPGVSSTSSASSASSQKIDAAMAGQQSTISDGDH